MFRRSSRVERRKSPAQMLEEWLGYLAINSKSAPEAFVQTMERMDIKITDSQEQVEGKFQKANSRKRKIERGNQYEEEFAAELLGESYIEGKIKVRFAWDTELKVPTVAISSTRFNSLLQGNQISEKPYPIVGPIRRPTPKQSFITSLHRIPLRVWAMLVISLLLVVLLLSLYGVK